MSDEHQFSKGAKVRKRYYVQPRANAAQAERSAPDTVKGMAYAFAKAHEHKSWARRWLRERRVFT